MTQVPPRLSTFESSSGAKIHRIPLEAYPNFWVYACLLIKDDYRVLIDCGSGTEKSHQGLIDGLAFHGLEPSDLTHLIVTHAHIDHYGGLALLKPMTSAKIGCHELDLPVIADHDQQSKLMEDRIAGFLVRAGVDTDEVVQLVGIYQYTKSLYRSVSVDFTYEAHGMKLGPLEMVHLPGHCAGHVAMRLEDIVICGDMVVEGVTPHLNPKSISPQNGLSVYLASLQKFLVWSDSARIFLNGHDEPFTDLPERINATHKNIVRRLRTAVNSMSTPLTIAEIAVAVYGAMGGYQKLLILEKTGAYMDYLLEHKMIEPVAVTELGKSTTEKYLHIKQYDDDELLSMLSANQPAIS